MAKNDFQYGGWKSYTLRCGTITTLISSGDCILQICSVAQPCRYCFYSVVQKWVFRPAGATRPLPRAKFHVHRAEMWEYNPQNCQNFKFWP